MTHSRRMKKSC